MKKFIRNLKLTYHFRNTTSKKPPFTAPSNWTPPNSTLPLSLHQTLAKIDQLLHGLNPPPEVNNLPEPFRQALRNLGSDSHIIIKPADKGSCLVIQDTTSYHFEAQRQLNNPLHYKVIQNPLAPATTQLVTDILQDLHRNQYITTKQLEYLSPPPNPRPRRFYLLPKIHKPPDSWTVPFKIPAARPIVSDCSSDTYAVSEFIDHYLQPLSTKHPSYLKDTYHFIDTLRSLTIPQDSLLVSLDVNSMYTNIDNTMGLTAIRSIFDQYPDPKRPNDQILKLLELNLEKNDFQYNETHYLQISGTAMGKKFAPSYCNIVAAYWEHQALSTCPLQPFLYKRFLDDIFIIWHHGRDSFDQFFHILNNFHASFTLKHTLDTSTLDYLDITIYKGPNFVNTGLLDTKVFFKPTDEHLLLHKESFHPPHTFRGIIKSQILRFYRICSEDSTFQMAFNTLSTALGSRGYNRRFIRSLKTSCLREISTSPPTDYVGAHPCHSHHCHACKYLLPMTSVRGTDGVTHNIPHSLTCQSPNVIYVISCTKCSLLYIGQTQNSLRTRHNAHISDIRLYEDTPIARHFNSAQHSLSHYRITPIQKATGTNCKAKLLELEYDWISKLGTLSPLGLNTQSGSTQSNITPFIVPYSTAALNLSTRIKPLFAELQNSLPHPFASKRLIISYKTQPNVAKKLISSRPLRSQELW